MNIIVNGQARALSQPQPLVQLLRELGFEGRRLAVERNGEIVPRSRYPEVELRDGDRLEIVQAIGGG